MAFAKDFVWGAASSAYQTEGSPQADGGGDEHHRHRLKQEAAEVLDVGKLYEAGAERGQ